MKATWLAAVIVAVVMAVTPVVAGGTLGVLGEVGTGSLIAAGMALLLFGIIGSTTIALSLAGMTRRRERAESELARRRRRVGTADLPDEDPVEDDLAEHDLAEEDPAEGATSEETLFENEPDGEDLAGEDPEGGEPGENPEDDDDNADSHILEFGAGNTDRADHGAGDDVDDPALDSDPAMDTDTDVDTDTDLNADTNADTDTDTDTDEPAADPSDDEFSERPDSAPEADD